MLTISWNKIFHWLQVVFHFGTENWEEQLKKPPCNKQMKIIPMLNNATDINSGINVVVVVVILDNLYL